MRVYVNVDIDIYIETESFACLVTLSSRELPAVAITRNTTVLPNDRTISVLLVEFVVRRRLPDRAIFRIACKYVVARSMRQKVGQFTLTGAQYSSEMVVVEDKFIVYATAVKGLGIFVQPLSIINNIVILLIA